MGHIRYLARHDHPGWALNESIHSPRPINDDFFKCSRLVSLPEKESWIVRRGILLPDTRDWRASHPLFKLNILTSVRTRAGHVTHTLSDHLTLVV